MNSRHALLSLALVLGLGAGATVLLQGSDAPFEAPQNNSAQRSDVTADSMVAEPKPTSSRAALAAPRVAEVDGFYRAAVGTRLEYAVDAELATTIGRPDEPAGEGLRFDLSGKATLLVVARREGELVVEWRFPQLEVAARAGDGQVNDKHGQLIAAALAQPALVRTAEDGTPLGYRFAPDVTADGARWVRTLVTAGQQIVRKTEGSYECDEPDATGIARVAYRWTEPAVTAMDRPGKLTKRKLAYVSIGGTPYAGDVQGRGQAEMDAARGVVRTANYRESVTIDVPEAGVRVQHRLRFAMELTSTEHGVAVDTIDLGSDAAWEPVVVTDTGTEDAKAFELQQYRQQLEGITLAQLLSELRSLANTEPLDRAALLDATAKLAGLILIDPAVLGELRGEILAGQRNETYAGALIGAIGGAGNEQAQGMLAELLRGELAADGNQLGGKVSDAVRESTAFSMFQLHEPNAVALQAAQTVAKAGSLGGTGMLLLGALAGNAKDTDHGSKGISALLAMEPKAERPGDASSWLLALGNHGGKQVGARARAHIGSADPNVRGAAAMALRGQRDPASTQALAGLALRDQNPTVRSRAAVVLTSRGDAVALDAATKSLANDKSVSVRRAVVEELGNHADKPQFHRLLQGVAKRDSDADLRRFAKELLDR